MKKGVEPAVSIRLNGNQVEVRSTNHDPWMDIGLLMEGMLVLVPMCENGNNGKKLQTKEEIVKHISDYLLKYKNDHVYQMPKELTNL